jgi:LPS export ABC transporter protein LptC
MTSSTLRREAGRAPQTRSRSRASARVTVDALRSRLAAPPPRVVHSFVACLLMVATWPAMASAPDHGWLEGDPGQILRLLGMTFVASEGSDNEIVLHAERARFYPDHDVADLERVEVEVAPGSGRVGFQMQCDRARLNLTSQDFVAEGNVVGTIQGGREFEALWVAYDEEDGILYTDEPVLITDEDGSYRGGGFRYFIHQQRFRLMGGASIVQEP